MKKLIEGIDSSSVEAIEYDTDTQQLTVEFNGGNVYDYFNVPEDVFEALGEAESVGHYLNENIKGEYSYEKVESNL